MALQVINGDQRNSQRQCQYLGGGPIPTTSAPTSPGWVATATASRSLGVIPSPRTASSIIGKELADVGPGCDLWNNASVAT